MNRKGSKMVVPQSCNISLWAGTERCERLRKDSEERRRNTRSWWSWKQLPFPFKLYPIFPVCSHISLPINALSVILEKLVSYWQKTCELNWQNSPANSFHPAVSALKMVGLCPSKRSLLYRYMNNEIMELGLPCQYRAIADEGVWHHNTLCWWHHIRHMRDILCTAGDIAYTLSQQTTVFIMSHSLQAWHHTPCIRYCTHCIFVITTSPLISHPLLNYKTSYALYRTSHPILMSLQYSTYDITASLYETTSSM